MSSSPVRLIALYLPQFHPIPENDAWWEPGFTEWTNATKAKPLYRGHHQPHLPADLGFYDLRVPEVRVAQADLARRFGIEAFCYYHYWFAGRRVLERPFAEVVRSGSPDFPFCVCWANQSWTGIWHGAPNKTLIAQTYPGDDDHRAHFEALRSAFEDPRHVRVDGKPLFVIYRPLEIPETKRVAELWKDMAIAAGLGGLHLVGFESDEASGWTPADIGFDALIRYRLPARKTWPTWNDPMEKVRLKARHAMARLRGGEMPVFGPTVHRYADLCDFVVGDAAPGIESYPCVIPNWDNTPRSGINGLVLQGSTPELFRKQVRRALDVTAHHAAGHRLVFVKSWNEWAEGNYLEPDREFGLGYLEALQGEVDAAAMAPAVRVRAAA